MGPSGPSTQQDTTAGCSVLSIRISIFDRFLPWWGVLAFHGQYIAAVIQSNDVDTGFLPILSHERPFDRLRRIVVEAGRCPFVEPVPLLREFGMIDISVDSHVCCFRDLTGCLVFRFCHFPIGHYLLLMLCLFPNG